MIPFVPGGSSQGPFHLQWGTYHPSSTQNEHHQAEKVARHLITFLGAQKLTHLLSHQGGVQACKASTFQKWMNVKISQWHWRFPKVSLHIQCPYNSLRTSGLSDNHKACKHKPFHHQWSVYSVTIKPPDHDANREYWSTNWIVTQNWMQSCQFKLLRWICQGPDMLLGKITCYIPFHLKGGDPKKSKK